MTKKEYIRRIASYFAESKADERAISRILSKHKLSYGDCAFLLALVFSDSLGDQDIYDARLRILLEQRSRN